MSETRVLIWLLRMYFLRNKEFGSALSKLRNFGGRGLNPPKTPLGTPLLYGPYIVFERVVPVLKKPTGITRHRSREPLTLSVVFVILHSRSTLLDRAPDHNIASIHRRPRRFLFPRPALYLKRKVLMSGFPPFLHQLNVSLSRSLSLLCQFHTYKLKTFNNPPTRIRQLCKMSGVL
jgi:hypothetical protein